jgi:hypothetical protein
MEVSLIIKQIEIRKTLMAALANAAMMNNTMMKMKHQKRIELIQTILFFKDLTSQP